VSESSEEEQQVSLHGLKNGRGHARAKRRRSRLGYPFGEPQWIEQRFPKPLAPLQFRSGHFDGAAPEAASPFGGWPAER